MPLKSRYTSNDWAMYRAQRGLSTHALPLHHGLTPRSQKMLAVVKVKREEQKQWEQQLLAEAAVQAACPAPSRAVSITSPEPKRGRWSWSEDWSSWGGSSSWYDRQYYHYGGGDWYSSSSSCSKPAPPVPSQAPEIAAAVNHPHLDVSADADPPSISDTD